MPALGPLPVLADSTFTSFDGDRFPYHRWLPASPGEPDLVVIGFHGIAGASTDMSNLGEHLRDHLPGTALYAPDLRGQGNDPIASRRGDIGHPGDWYRDAHTFTRLIRARHPASRVVWCGESMGALIALHALAHARASAPDRALPCDALILSSPIARLPADFPAWRRVAFRWGAALLPKLRLSLETLSGERDVEVIKGVVHQDQVRTNPYHVPAFTLRLLHTLGTMIEGMCRRAADINLPVLLLHGGNDIFSRARDVEALARSFPPSPLTRRVFYPESYHLLFYDHQRERVLREIARWLRKIKGS